MTVQSLGDWLHALCRTVCEDVSRDKGTDRLLDGVPGCRKEVTGDEI